MSIIIAIVLSVVVVASFIAAAKGWIQDQTIQRFLWTVRIVGTLIVIGIAIHKIQQDDNGETPDKRQEPAPNLAHENSGQQPIDTVDSLAHDSCRKTDMGIVRPVEPPIDTTGPVQMCTLVIDVSREIDKPHIYVDKKCQCFAFECTVSVAQGDHDIEVSYTDHWGTYHQYTNTVPVTSDYTLSVERVEIRPLQKE